MSWVIFLGYLAKILFFHSHAKILQIRTNLDIFMVSTMARSWQDLTRFSMFFIKVYQVSVLGFLSSCERKDFIDSLCEQTSFCDSNGLQSLMIDGNFQYN